MVNRYYAYDKEENEFVKIDGELAEIGEHFVEEMKALNSSFLIFIKKDEYDKGIRELNTYQGGLNVGD